MTFHAYNTLSRRKEPLEPVHPGRVGFYVCGPTVYDLIHIGNARPLVVFDVLFRLLRHGFGAANVTYVRNITDVDDKINAAARERGIAIGELTATTTARFHEDARALGCLPPTEEPRATGHIPEMIALIERLLASGHAYEAESHVLFDVASWPDYGRLSGNSRDEIVAGARVEVAPYKKDAADFVLWKPTREEGLPWWESPWGRGRPGWHLECSAMSMEYLGRDFDIHGGGRDLIFPHHENEIAQTCAAHADARFARIWMHNGYVTVNGEKMAKSAGNFLTVRDLLEEFPGEVLRFALLKTHYRQPLDFTKEGVREARRELNGLYTSLRVHHDVEATDASPDAVSVALSDDLNTPLAISHLHELRTDLNNADQWGKSGEKPRLKGELLAAGMLLGILQQDPEVWFLGRTSEGEAAEIESLIERRNAARKLRDFKEADRIRDALNARGVELMDGPDGTTWRRAGLPAEPSARRAG